MRRRHERKKAKQYAPWEYDHDDGWIGRNADRGRAVALYRQLVARHGARTARAMFTHAMNGPTKAELKLDRYLKLVRRLVTMPDTTRNKLARIVVGENRQSGEGSTNLETVKRQIDDALAAVRKYREATGIWISVNTPSKGLDEDMFTRYGIEFFGGRNINHVR
jgi:hypothetical protein